MGNWYDVEFLVFVDNNLVNVCDSSVIPRSVKAISEMEAIKKVSEIEDVQMMREFILDSEFYKFGKPDNIIVKLGARRYNSNFGRRDGWVYSD